MAAYLIVFMEDVSDPAALQEYRRLGLPTLADRDVKFHIRPGKLEVLEGAPVQAVTMLEFPTMEEAKAWYDSPEYQAAVTARRKGVRCHAVLAEGA